MAFFSARKSLELTAPPATKNTYRRLNICEERPRKKRCYLISASRRGPRPSSGRCPWCGTCRGTLSGAFGLGLSCPKSTSRDQPKNELGMYLTVGGQIGDSEVRFVHVVQFFTKFWSIRSFYWMKIAQKLADIWFTTFITGPSSTWGLPSLTSDSDLSLTFSSWRGGRRVRIRSDGARADHDDGGVAQEDHDENEDQDENKEIEDDDSIEHDATAAI